MAKRFVIYANGKDLALVPVVQNEVGKYYRNSTGTYYKPILAEFDNASLPTGYKAYIGGSHAKYINDPIRHPIDLSLIAGTVITANFDVYIRGFTLAGGSWCKAQIAGTSTMLGFVHTYQWASIGLVPAGQPICKIAPKSVTGFDPHLHMDEWTGLKIRDLILNGDFKMTSTLKIGDKVRIVGGNMNIRKGAGTGFSSITGVEEALKEGAVVQIKDGIRTSQNKQFYNNGSSLNVNDTYQWIDVVDVAGVSGWIAITNRVELVHGNTALTKLDGTSPTPPPVVVPVDPTIELNIQIGVLKTEIVGLKEALGTSQSSLKLAEERIKFLEDDKTTWEEELKQSEMEVLKAKQESTSWHNQYVQKVTELNALKKSLEHWAYRLGDILYNIFNKQ